MIVIVKVAKGTRVLTMSVGPECETAHYTPVQPKAVVRKHTEIGDRDLCVSCMGHLADCVTLCAYDAVDNPVILTEEV